MEFYDSLTKQHLQRTQTVLIDTNGVPYTAGSAPSPFLTDKGDWNASTNTPALGAGGTGGVDGDYFRVSVAGVINFDYVSSPKFPDIVYKQNGKWYLQRNSVGSNSGLIYGSDDGGTTLRPALTDASGRLITKTSNDFEEMVWVDSTQTYFIRRITISEAGVPTISYTLPDGTAYVPVAPILPATAGSDREVESLTYIVINAGVGYSLNDVIKRIIIIDAITSTVLTNIYYNLNTSAVVTPLLADLQFVKQEKLTHSGASFDSVRVGDGTDLLAINTDGSLNNVITDGTDTLAINTGGSINTRLENATGGIDYNVGTPTAQTIRTTTTINDGVDTMLVNTDGSINVSLVSSNLEKIKNSNDKVETYTFLGAGTSDERVSTIVYTSATLGLTVTETYVWAGVAGAYYLSTITLS